MDANPKKAFGDKKPPLGLVPLSALIHATMAYYDGAGKYGRANWRENHVEAQTYVEAILRHVLLWANGEENARDTGVHNLGGVIASAGLLLDAQTNGVLIDNRIKSQANCDLLHEAETLLEKLKAQHAERHAAQEEAGRLATAVEAYKRHQATVALLQYADLIRSGEHGGATGAAADVLLNMVNGVFPDDPTKGWSYTPGFVDPEAKMWQADPTSEIGGNHPAHDLHHRTPNPRDEDDVGIIG